MGKIFSEILDMAPYIIGAIMFFAAAVALGDALGASLGLGDMTTAFEPKWVSVRSPLNPLSWF